MGKEQRDGRLSVSIWVYFGGELYITLYVCVYFSVFVCTTLLHAGCIFIGPESDHWECLSVTD